MVIFFQTTKESITYFNFLGKDKENANESRKIKTMFAFVLAIGTTHKSYYKDREQIVQNFSKI